MVIGVVCGGWCVKVVCGEVWWCGGMVSGVEVVWCDVM